MSDMTTTIAPKSDQLNADDLIGRTLTIKVTKVKVRPGEREQPVDIHYEGDNGKPYKPCLGMRRALVQIWGKNGAAYVGRSMTLYREDSVTWGGAPVGGIRISHLSHIDREITIYLTVSKSARKPFTFLPLATVEDADPELVKAGAEAAAKGYAALKAWGEALPEDQKNSLHSYRAQWVSIAKRADAAASDEALNLNDSDVPADETAGDGSLQCERMKLSAGDVKLLTPYADAKGQTVLQVANNWDGTKKELGEHVKKFYADQQSAATNQQPEQGELIK